MLPRHRRGRWQTVLGLSPPQELPGWRELPRPRAPLPVQPAYQGCPTQGRKWRSPCPNSGNHPGSGHPVEPAGVFTETVPGPISPRPNPTSALPVLSCRCPELSQHKHPARGPSPRAGFPGNPGLSFSLKDSDDPSALGLCCLQGTRGDFSDAWMTK